jgi:interleukin-1 receptor-associated kinase 4
LINFFRLIEQAGVTQRRPCAEIFLDEWGTSGRKQPDLAFLLQQLGKAELFRAADYVADLMKGMTESQVNGQSLKQKMMIRR